jgi:hypothetical protein
MRPNRELPLSELIALRIIEEATFAGSIRNGAS